MELSVNILMRYVTTSVSNEIGSRSFEKISRGSSPTNPNDMLLLAIKFCFLFFLTKIEHKLCNRESSSLILIQNLPLRVYIYIGSFVHTLRYSNRRPNWPVVRILAYFTIEINLHSPRARRWFRSSLQPKLPLSIIADTHPIYGHLWYCDTPDFGW